MKHKSGLLFVVSAGFLASCQSMRPLPEPVSLQEALVETVQAIKAARAQTNDGTKIGLVPAEAVITFKVTGAQGSKGGITGEGTIPGGPKLGVSFERTRSRSAENTIVLTLKTIYKTGDRPTTDIGPFFMQPFMNEGALKETLMKDPDFVKKMRAALQEQ